MATTTTTANPRAPGHLRSKTASWWRSVVRDYQLEQHHVRLLTLAAEAWDRAEEARETNRTAIDPVVRQAPLRRAQGLSAVRLAHRLANELANRSCSETGAGRRD